MKLEGIWEDMLYTSDSQNVYDERGGLEFTQVSHLPSLGIRTGSLSRLLQTNSVTKEVLSQLVGPYLTTNVWRVTTDELYATQGNRLFRSLDNGNSWVAVRQLPASSGPMGILPSGFCAHEGIIYLGEYPLDRSQQPRLLASRNDGVSWTTIASFDARHIHSVQVDPYTGDRWITTGDTDDESMILRLSEGELEVIGTGSQLWRAVDLAFTPSAILWGMDCPYTEENRIVKLDRNDLNAEDPPVETLHTVSSPVYYAETLEISGEYHVFFSTAIEPATEPQHEACVLHATSADSFETWETVVSYKKGRHPLSTIVDTNSYIFMATHPERGLFVNPYNTQKDHGTIRNVPVTQFQQSREPLCYGD